MLTVHDHTFELTWQGWGKHTPRDEVRQLATRETARASMVQGARLVLKNKGIPMPPTGILRLEVINAAQ